MNRFLGIDYGTVRIGLALSDPSGILASPLPFLENKSPQQISSALTQLAQTHQVEQLIVGLPRTIDERLTTAQATKELSGFGLSHKELRKKVDSSSACLILQQFLDRQQPLL